MAAMAGLLHHAQAGVSAMTAARPQSNSASGAAASPMAAGANDATDGSSSSDTSTISANDFLSLLVTEMQNQDPTADTDPNEYINQLVQINSLEQLIDINQNLSTVLGTAAGSSDATSAGGAATPGTSAVSQSGHNRSNASHAPAGAVPANGHAANSQAGNSMRGARTSNTAAAMRQFADSQMAKSAGVSRAPGNLGVPKDQGAAHRVAHALDGHSHAPAATEKHTGKP